ncbi:MAG: redox-sensitive transcriptional activator SoxR [Thermoleophilia bacterium]|nr:redox-sensitive transcriptional activator SoxR [Thermoleophilia bacterium]
MGSEAALPIGVVSARAGVAASALRFYEERGLIASVRSPGGRRAYDRSVLRRLAFIRAAQNVGLGLAEIGEAMAALPDGRPPTPGDWSRLARAWGPRLDARIAALQALRDGLDGCIGCGCLSAERCPLANPGDRAAARGPGAAYLPPLLRRAIR